MAKKQAAKAVHVERVLAAQEVKPIALDDAVSMAEVVASVAATPPEERDGLAIYAATERVVGRI
jgi:hypothetical protein